MKIKIVDLCKKRRKLSNDEIEALEDRLRALYILSEVVNSSNRKICKEIQHLYVIKGTMIPHRKNGPAVVLKKGKEMWMQYGQLHRENGMARAGILDPSDYDAEDLELEDYWIHGEWFPSLKKYLKILGKESMINYL